MVHSTFADPERGVDTWVFWQACACGCDGMHIHANEYRHGTMDPINIDEGATYFPRDHRFRVPREDILRPVKGVRASLQGRSLPLRKLTWWERVGKRIRSALKFSPLLAALATVLLVGCASPTEPTEPMEIKVRMTYCNADRTVCRDTVMPR